MPTSIREEDRCWSEMLASSYTHYGAKGGQTPATLILGAYDILAYLINNLDIKTKGILSKVGVHTLGFIEGVAHDIAIESAK